jgi:hypothetical protein
LSSRRAAARHHVAGAIALIEGVLFLASVPWFLQDLGTYGIAIFTPTILAAAVGANEDHARSIADLIQKDITAARVTSLLGAAVTWAFRAGW